MPSANVYVPINSSTLILVEEMKECLETQFLIQASQQDIIESAIVFLNSRFFLLLIC